MPASYQCLLLLFTVLCAACLFGCVTSTFEHSGQITRAPFGKTSEGTDVDVFSLRNSKGAEARISNYGCLLVSFKVPDKQGQLTDVVLGFDRLEDYLKGSPYLGAVVGRYANRIAKGKFSLGGKEYTLAVNNGPNALHGGIKGFDKVVWEPRVSATPEGPAIELSYLSKDGEEGYPGNLSVRIRYTMTEDNALKIEFTGTTDKETIVNLTEHSYFNLAGSGDILNHEVMIPADKFTPIDSNLIPTGELRSVAGTPFDFRSSTPIGARINGSDEQLQFGGGYDHNFVVNKPPGQLGLMARVHDPSSGRILEVFSTEPGLQFYTANRLGGLTGKGGWAYKSRNAFCMESHHFPDSPNKSNFPSVVLKPGEVYQNTIIYRVSVGEK